MTERKHPGALAGASGAGKPFRMATEGTRTLSPQGDNAKPIAALRVRRLRALGIAPIRAALLARLIWGASDAH